MSESNFDEFPAVVATYVIREVEDEYTSSTVFLLYVLIWLLNRSTNHT